MAKIWRTFNSNWEQQAVYYSDEPPMATAADKYMTVDDGPTRQLFISYAGWWQPYSDLGRMTKVITWPNPFAEAYTYVSSRSGETKVSFTKAYPIAARDEWVDEKCHRLVNENVTIKGLLHEIYTELSGE